MERSILTWIFNITATTYCKSEGSIWDGETFWLHIRPMSNCYFGPWCPCVRTWTSRRTLNSMSKITHFALFIEICSAQSVTHRFFHPRRSFWRCFFLAMVPAPCSETRRDRVNHYTTSCRSESSNVSLVVLYHRDIFHAVHLHTILLSLSNYPSSYTTTGV